MGYKINAVNYRNTTEPTSVHHYCASVKRGLEVYEKLVPNIQIKSCEQAGHAKRQNAKHQFILKMKMF